MKEHVIAQLVGATILAITGLGLFASRADVSDLKAEVYKVFIPREEIMQRLDNISRKLDDLSMVQK